MRSMVLLRMLERFRHKRSGLRDAGRYTSAVSAPGLLLVLALAALPMACRAPDGLESSNPYERARAAVERAEAGDANAAHRLVALLEDEDPGVRLFAILALERLCGETLGYRYYDDEALRREAVQRWRAALQNGDVRVLGKPAGGAAAQASANSVNAEGPR